MNIKTIVNPSQFKLGMRRLASGVTIVATAFEKSRYGLIVTAVNSVSADPPMLLICVSQDTFAHDFISKAGHFSVNVLHANDRSIAENFTRPELRLQRFSFGQWSTLLTGSPVLDTALASFDCVISQETRVASHTVFFGQVVKIRLQDGSIDPLLYWNGAYRTGDVDLP